VKCALEGRLKRWQCCQCTRSAVAHARQETVYNKITVSSLETGLSSQAAKGGVKPVRFAGR